MNSSEASRRHLPPWMLRARPTGQASNSVSEVKKKENGMEELPPEGGCPKSEGEVQQHTSDVTTSQGESIKTDPGLLKKCKTTRSKRKLAKRAVDNVSHMHEGDLEKENYAPPRRKRKAKVFKAAGSKAIEECTLSDDELTVDDLISIAKEYINAEKGQEQEKCSLMECESEHLPQSISSEEKSYDKVTTSSREGISNMDTLEGSSSDLVECQPIERGVVSSSKTGDPAHDMLDLFLGGLLKRSEEVKRNPEPVTKSIKLDYVSTNQICDEPVGAMAPMHKKKGSLKDKVAMLLN